MFTITTQMSSEFEPFKPLTHEFEDEREAREFYRAWSGAFGVEWMRAERDGELVAAWDWRGSWDGPAHDLRSRSWN